MSPRKAASPTAPTAPEPRLKRRNYGRGHGYLLDGVKIMGVTTAIDVIDKGALRQWYAEQATNRAIDDWDELAQLPISERRERIRWGARDTKQAAALRGTQIHGFGEALARGEEPDVPDEHRGPVEAYARWLDKWEVETVGAETPLCHTRYGYGGTADLWGRVGKLDGALCLLDVKTGKGVYNETALQLAAYRYADLIQIDGAEVPGLEVEHVLVAHVLPDDVRTLPVLADDETFRAFQYVLEVARRRKGWEDWPLIGSAVQPGESW
jgi:hypothetical protein